jgi:hypothetical protein
MSVSTAHPPLPRVLRRRLKANKVWRRWTAAWVGGSVLGIANGVIRELSYKDRVGEPRANQIAVGVLVALLALYFAVLEYRWPIPSLRAAIAIGATWVVLTVVFEFVFGHWVDGKKWSELFENYNVADGRLWFLALVWIAAGPSIIRRIRLSIGGES